MMNPTQGQAVDEMSDWVDAVTVFWDIKAFPLCNARQVCLYIKQHLEDYDHYGPFTIYAIGLLTHVPIDVLRDCSSSGIILKHVPFDFIDIMNQWSSVNLPPANTFVISPSSSVNFAKVVAPLKAQGYNILRLFNYSNWNYFCVGASETLVEEDKGSETGEHASWVCSVSHDISGNGFENFITHLSQEHKLKEAVEAGDASTILRKQQKGKEATKGNESESTSRN